MIIRKFGARLVRHAGRTFQHYSTKRQEPQFPARRIFSGIQPTGQIHLGNYLGAVAQWIKLQNENEDIILSIVDLHSITIPQDPKTLRNNIVEMAATLLACGIDPKKVILFQQSMVPAHTHLSWCLGCISTMARLAHMNTYKEKAALVKEVPLGLYVYPVLQAADILAYKATHVPVGEDQAQNIEFTKEIARMFNKRYGCAFPIPNSIVTDSVYARLKSLRDPSKKMSKSDPDPKSRICLTDPPDEIVQKLKKAVTDSNSTVTFEPNERLGVSNLVSIHSFVTGKPVEEICKEAEGINTGKYKLVVAEAVIEHFKPIQKEMAHLLDNQDYLFHTLKAGAEKASEIAEKTVEEVKCKLGLAIEVQFADKKKVQV